MAVQCTMMSFTDFSSFIFEHGLHGLNGLEPERSAALHGDGAKDCGDDGGGVLEYGEYFCPVYFHDCFCF